MKKKGLLLLFLFGLLSRVPGQQPMPGDYTDISKVLFVKSISKTVSSALATKEQRDPANFMKAAFQPGVVNNGAVSTGMVPHRVLLTFNLLNSSDSTTAICFFPGFYYNYIRLYRVTAGSIQPLPDEMPAGSDSIGFRKLKLAAHDSATFIAELGFVKTYVNAIRPRLINANQADVFMSSLRSEHQRIQLMSYVFCGLLLMMILFSFSNFLQGANREFLYYSGYALFLGGMLFAKAMFDFHTTPVSFYVEAYLDFIMQCMGIMFYMMFMQKFLDTRRKHPFLYKLYATGIVLLITSMVSFTILHYFTDNYTLQYQVENITKLLLLVMVIIFLVYSLRKWQDKLLRFLFWGNLLLFIFSLLSQLAVMELGVVEWLPGIFSSALFYYQMGLFLELVLFLAGLNYKNRRQLIAQTREREALKAQNQLQEIEKQLAVLKAQQQERERISADMHDELGAGMTAIRLMSEIARNKMKDQTPPELERISSSANEVLNKMNAIIWSMNSGNDTVDNLISYIRTYAFDYFEGTPVHCKVETPGDIPEHQLSGDKRRNIFLCIKETLNNTLKHAGATEVIIRIAVAGELEITIRDNGKGFDAGSTRPFGNGLKNIARRMESIGGSFAIQNENGTVTTLRLPLV